MFIAGFGEGLFEDNVGSKLGEECTTAEFLERQNSKIRHFLLLTMDRSLNTEDSADTVFGLH